MQTSNFASVKKIIAAGLEPVGIAVGPPRWYTGKNYKDLAPTYRMLKLPREEYDRQFAAILARLDPRKVCEDLGEGAVLLCWEKPGQACHRRIVAEWIETALGLVVPEFGFERHQTPPYAETPWAAK